MKNLSEHLTEEKRSYQRALGEAWTDLERAVERAFVDSGEADISDRAMIWNAQQKAALDRSSEARLRDRRASLG